MDYHDMLERGLEQTSDVTGDEDGRSFPTPDVRQEGNTTIVTNASGIADDLNRDLDHLATFLQTDQGTNGHVDDSGRIHLTGQFRPAHLEDAISSYVDGYVVCPECGLPDTRLVDESGATMRRCEACGARSPVDD